MTGKIFLLILGMGLAAPAGTRAAEAEGSVYRAPATEVQWITSGSNITRIATGVRVTRHHWYGEAGFGGLEGFGPRETAFFLGLNLGRRVFLLPRLYLGADLGYRHVIPDGSDDPAVDTGKYFTLEGRLRLEVVLGRHLSLFLGGGAANIYQGYSLGSDVIHQGSVFWGVGLL